MTVFRAHVWVSGRVQGVWYRQSCADAARELGVCGWVRNCSDGRVEAVFEGPSDAVERAVAWCRIGPSRAEVHGVKVDRGDEPEGLSGFSVR